MKYFNPSYWFKLWLLSAPLFNDKTQGINAKSIDNKKIKDWASKNTTNISLLENQELTLSNNQTTLLNLPLWNSNLTTHNEHHKHRHQKSRNRYKRLPIPPSKEIFQLSEKLIINQNNPNQYRSSFQSILESLTNNNILRIVFDDSENRNWGENSRIFSLNSQNYGYFRLPVQIIQEQNGQSNQINLELVLSTDALYIQGFIINHHDTGAHTSNIETYYYFNPDLGTPSGRYNPQLREVTGITNSIMLSQIGNAYRHLIPTENNNINWETIYNSFLRLTNDINVNIERPLGNLARALGQVIFVTAEAIRFPNIYARIVSHLITRNENINLESNQRNEIYRILVNWGTNSRDSIFRWLLQIANIIQNTPNIMISPPSMLDFTRALSSPAVQVVLGYIEFQRLRNNRRNVNCRRGKRELKNTYWHEKFCDLKPEIDKIQGKITSIKVLDENTKGGHLKSGDIYIGTDNGVYLIHGYNRVDKFEGLNFPIKDIILDGKGSAYVINEQFEIYHLNLVGYGSEKIRINNKIPSGITITTIKVLENDSTDNQWVKKGYIFVGTSEGLYTIHQNGNLDRRYSPVTTEIKDIFIKDNNSLYFQVHNNKIYFLKFSDWSGELVLNANSDKIVEIQIFNDNNFIFLLALTTDGVYYIHERVLETDKYKINNKVYSICRSNNGDVFFYTNNGLYLAPKYSFDVQPIKHIDNNDCKSKLNKIINNSKDELKRKKREIFDINNLEEKNVTKWTNEFTKSINNEQHLPITNNTNFVTNNITSL